MQFDLNAMYLFFFFLKSHFLFGSTKAPMRAFTCFHIYDLFHRDFGIRKTPGWFEQMCLECGMVMNHYHLSPIKKEVVSKRIQTKESFQSG